MSLHERKIYPKFVAQYKDGKLRIENSEEFFRYLIVFADRPFHLVPKKIHKERSRQEEKFYRGYILPAIAESMAIPEDEVHAMLAAMFLTEECRTDSGYRYTRVLSTTELSDIAYRQYWERVILWAAQPTNEEEGGLNQSSGIGLPLKYPNEIDFESF